MVDLTGKIFGRLTAIEFCGINKSGHPMWLCQCVCGNIKDVDQYKLKSGHTRNCGCLKKEIFDLGKGAITHKDEGSPTYVAWTNMKQRCYNKNHQQYKNYGSRGITVCDRWLDKKNGYINLKSLQSFKNKKTIEGNKNNDVEKKN